MSVYKQVIERSKPSAAPSVTVVSSTASLAIERNLRSENDALRKELARKDSRNDNLTKEMQVLRTANGNTTRELKILTSTFDKLNHDRHSLSNELSKSKEYIEKLEYQLSRLNDSAHMCNQVDVLTKHNSQLKSEMDQYNKKLNYRDDRIKVLEKEIDVLHRTFEIQRDYEGGDPHCRGGGSCGCNCCTKGGEGSKEKLRSLYYELGKRQTENHTIALSLAESHKEIELLKLDLKNVNSIKVELEKECQRLKEHSELLLQQTKNDNELVSSLHEKQANITDINNKLQQSLEDITRRYTEYKNNNDNEIFNKNKVIAELHEVITGNNLEISSLNHRLESLQQSINHIDSVNTLSEQRLQSEWDTFNTEKNKYQEQLKKGDAAMIQEQLLRNEVHSLKVEKDELLNKYSQLTAALNSNKSEEKQQLVALKFQVSELEQFLNTSRSNETRAVHERDEAMKALMQTVEATRELSGKYQKERNKRINLDEKIGLLEKNIADLKKSKEQVSSAVLDALHKERSKSQALEQVLNSLSIDVRKVQSVGGIIPPSPEPQARPPLPMPTSRNGQNNFSPSKNTTIVLHAMDNASDQTLQKVAYASTPAPVMPVVGMVEELKKLHEELKALDTDSPSSLSSSFYNLNDTNNPFIYNDTVQIDNPFILRSDS